ncbi:MAG: hypothetical protein ABJL35_00060 [Parasphingorhabdus sp.]
MREFRLAETDRYGHPKSDPFKWLDADTLDMLVQLKVQEDELEASYY